MTLIENASRLAELAHQGQTRRGGEPYINHPARVSSRVILRPAWTEEEVAAAWLHDAVENGGTTFDALAQAGIPPRVLEAVRALTKTKGEPYYDYLERVAADPIARSVKLADIADNLADKPNAKQMLKYSVAVDRLLGGA